jgi:uncharacterized CHY-type Zn-finger protein
MRLPRLLPVSQIDQIDPGNVEETTRTLREKILEPAMTKARQFECQDCTHLQKNNAVKAALLYACEPKLVACLEAELRSRSIRRIQEEESKKELRICRICQALRVANYAFIQVADEDLDSFIVLGMAKAIGVKTLPLRLERYAAIDFAWSRESIPFTLDGMDQQLSTPLAKFLTF